MHLIEYGTVAEPDEASRAPDQERLISGISAILVGVCGPTLFIVIPFFLTFVKQGLGFDESHVSLISSADMLGMFLANGLAAVWIRSANWRTVAVLSVLLLIVATGCSLIASSFVAFGLSRVAAGFGAGSLMGIGLTAMGERRRADAWFGWFVAAQALLGTITAWAIPRFVAPYGLHGLLFALLGIYVLLLPAAMWIPGRSRSTPVGSSDTPSDGPSLGLAILSLVAAFSFYMGVFAVWSHIDLIGRAAGLDPTKIGNAVSLGYLLGIPASIAAVVLAGRIPRLALFAAIGAMHLAPLMILYTHPAYAGFTAATLMLGWLWYFAAPPQMGLTVSVDPTGRFIVLFVAAMKSSYVAAGAVLAALLAGGASLNRVLILSGICGIVSLILYILLAIKAPRRA